MTTEELEAIDVGANIRRVREARGMTQKEVARKAGVGQNVVGLLEDKGPSADPRLATVVLIADALGVGVSELIAPPGASGTSLEAVREYIGEQRQETQEAAPQPVLPPSKPQKPDKKKFAKLKKLVNERMAVDEMVLVLGKGYISADEKLELRRITTEIINEAIRLYKKGAFG